MARAVTEEAPFTPIRPIQVEQLVAPEIAPSAYTPRQVKDLELRTGISGEIGGKVRSPLEQPYSSIQGVLDDYNRGLNKALYTVAPEVQPVGQAMATERTIQENVLGISRKDELTPTNVAEKIAKYVRERGKDEGLTAENARTAEALARLDVEKMPKGAETLSEIESIIKPTVERYKTASERKSYIPAPVVGETKAKLATLGLTRMASAAGHQYRATKDTVNKITPDIVKRLINSGVVSDKSIAAHLSTIALENDPMKRNALVFSLSQMPRGTEALQAIQSQSSSVEDLPPMDEE